jgi:hypothetical protein
MNFHQVSTAAAVPAIPYTGSPDDLSFVTRKDAGGLDYWNVESAGSYGADCKLGHRLGQEFLAYIGAHPTNGNVTLLGMVAASMVDNAIEGHRVLGAEIGFMHEVSGYATAMAAFRSERNVDADPDAEIVATYEKWCTDYDEFARYMGPDGGDDALYQKLIDAGNEVVRLRPVTARGLAIQFAVFTNFGEFEATKDNFHNFEEAVLALAAVEPPTQFRKSDFGGDE